MGAEGLRGQEDVGWGSAGLRRAQESQEQSVMPSLCQSQLYFYLPCDLVTPILVAPIVLQSTHRNVYIS